MNAFISSQFSYCPLIWMCHSRSLNSRINRIHERALRIVYKDNDLSFDSLLEKSASVRIHHRNLQILATEIYKVLHDLSPTLMKEIFQLRNSKYNLRKNPTFETRDVKSVFYGNETISYLGPKIWEQVPNEIKKSASINIFKNKIKDWIPNECPCRLSKVFIANLGSI